MNDNNRHEPAEKLYNAITGLPDGRVEEAMPPQTKPKKSAARKMILPLAACLVLVFGCSALRLGLFGHLGGAGGGGGEAGEVYMSYAGPVFPLSAAGEADLTAARSVNYDFSPYAPHQEREETPDGTVETWTVWKSKAIVTDSYTLTNPRDAEQTVTLLYPFAASLVDGAERIPALTVDGRPAEASLHIGPTAEGYKDLFGSDSDAANQPWNLIDLCGWTSYKTILEAGYQARALAEPPSLDRPVTVYRLTNCAPPAGYEGEFFDLAVEYRGEIPMLTYGFNFGSNDPEAGTHVRGCGIFTDGAGQTVPTLIVLNGDLEDCAVRAYAGGGMEAPLEGASWTLEREETTLAAVLTPIAGEMLAHSTQDTGYVVNALTPTEYLELLAGTLYDQGVLTGDPAQCCGGGMLEELLNSSDAADRVFYLSFDMTLPAHGTAEVSARMVKPASFDFTGEDRDRNGYDLVTTLGSPLVFTAQTASVTNTDYVEITAQSFGFDPENGVTSVTLDPHQEHYYLEVVRRTSSG